MPAGFEFEDINPEETTQNDPTYADIEQIGLRHGLEHLDSTTLMASILGGLTINWVRNVISRADEGRGQSVFSELRESRRKLMRERFDLTFSKSFVGLPEKTQAAPVEPLPERLPTEPLPDYFLRVITPNNQDEFEADLQPVQESLLSLYGEDPEAVVAIEKECDLLRWRFFGQPNEPLPEAVYVSTIEGRQYPQIIQNAFGTQLAAVRKKYEKQQEAFLQSHLQELQEIALEDVREMPIMTYLTSFASPHVTRTMRELPLDEAQRARRIAEITQNLTQQYGIDASQLQRPANDGDFNAHRSFVRAVARLDMEVEPRIYSEQTDPKEGPYERLHSAVKQHIASMVSVERGKAYTADDVEVMMPYSVNVGDIKDLSLSVYAQRIVDSFEDPYKMPNMAMEAMLLRLLDGAMRSDRQPYLEALEELMKSRANRRLHSLFTNSWSAPMAITEQMWIRRPLVPEPYDRPRSYHHPDGNTQPQLTLNEMGKRLDETVGVVLRDTRIDDKVRLIASVAETKRPSELNWQADVLIAFEDYKKGMEPYVPGFTVSSAYKEHGMAVFALTKDADHNPYEQCPATIPEEAIPKIAHSYRAYGYSELADAVAAVPNMSVHAFASLVRSHLTYSTESQSGRAVDVKDGKLFVQCVGADEILRTGLQIAFPDSTRAIGGILLPRPGDNEITGLQHRQTLFMHEGKRYILDATPDATEVIKKAYEHNRENGGSQQNPRPRRPAHMLGDSPLFGSASAAPVEAVAAVRPSPEQEAHNVLAGAAQAAEIIRTNFENAVRTRLHIADDPRYAAAEDFYRYVLATATVPDEPLRQAFSLVFDAGREQPNNETIHRQRTLVEHATAHVQAMQNATSLERKKFGNVTDDATLRTVQAVLRQLTAHYNRLAWAFTTLTPKH